MIEVHLYGRLRGYGPTLDPSRPCVVLAVPGPGQETVGDLVLALGIPGSEIASVFSDGRWVREGLDAPLDGARRLGLFPPEMSLLYV
jgi:hypothetical protein